ncbi:MAG: hypothetical protein M0004_09070 [Actinomycetota bacterium]|nr:hypothetical protein [Actinomycetota bacterium]
MVLDPALLAEASARHEALAAARQRLAAAEAALQRAVEALERSGATPEEIAEALGMAGLTHPGGDAPTSPPAAEHDSGRCSFCGRAQHEVSHLIAGPNRYICGQCIAAIGTMLEGRAAAIAAPPARAVPSEEVEQVCSFCGKRRAQVTDMASGSGAAICAECLALGADIIGPGPRS